MFLSGLRFFHTFFEYSFGEKFKDFFLSEKFKDPNSDIGKFNVGWSRAVHLIFMSVPCDICFYYIIILQIQEWKSMLLIIKSQLGQRNEEILFNYNHEENVSKSTSPLQLVGIHQLNLQKNFCRMEKIMALRFLILRYGFVLIHITMANVYFWIEDNNKV